jgi:G3E family GTPase
MKHQTDIILITGFLGAGKTTFLNRLLAHFRQARTGIIVNDFGEVAVDGDLIRANPSFLNSGSEQLIEIANGSIFCSCLQSAFLDGLTHYAHHRTDLLMIETSGMSDPSSMERLLASEEVFRTTFNLMASYCLIDAVSFLDLADHFLFIENQVKACDIAVISKTEQVEREVLPAIHSKLRSFQPGILILENDRSDEELFDAKSISSVINRFAAHPIQSPEIPPLFHGCQAVARPQSFFLVQKPVELNIVTRFFDQIRESVYRVKGFLQVENEIHYIDGANGKISIVRTDLNPAHLGVSVFASAAVKEETLRQWASF